MTSTVGYCYECKQTFEPKVVWKKSSSNLGQKMPYLVPPCHPKAAWQFATYVRADA